MKKLLAAFIIFALYSDVSGQTAKEVKINALGVIINNFTLGYEHSINDESSAGLWVNYQEYNIENLDEDGNEIEDKISGLGFIPEYRFYFNPNDEMDGVFAGPYLKYSAFSQTGDYFGYSEVNPDEIDIFQDVNVTSRRFVLGVTLGNKWATRGGFVFEATAGAGRLLANSEEFDNENVVQYREDNNERLFDFNIDLRLGLSAGFRF